MTKAKVQYANSVKKNGNFFRIILHQYDQSNRLMWIYEIWPTLKAIQNKYPDVKERPTQEQLNRFAVDFYDNRMKEVDFEPKESGVFISSTQVVYSDPNTFPHSVNDLELENEYKLF